MACGHVWKQINDIGICQKCGLIINKKGEVMFDRDYVNYINKRGGKKCAKK